ncbi:MAG: DUF6057 family protein [Tannerellaceae bacterium]|jgi:hypothetical protein|nr:DUF6057 family protein [Tannerellaceae bacterium]
MSDWLKVGHKSLYNLVIFAACCFSFFQFVLPYHLFFKEQMQLFLLTKEYFLSYAGKPAWAACYAGDFLTQFFYLRGGGAATLTLALCLEYALWVTVLRHIGLKRYAAFSALLPVVADGFLHCGLYYELPASISVIIVLAAFEAFILIKRPVAAFIAGIALLPVLYTMAGVSFLLFPVLIHIYMWRKGECGRIYLTAITITTALSAGIYPATVRSHYLLTPEQAYRYPFPASLNVRGADLDREKILSLSVEAARGRWDEVGRRAQAAGMDNPVVTYYANIALSKQGRLPDELLNYYQPFTGGLFLPVNPQSGRLTIFFSNEVFYHLGDMNMAQHSAMLGMIFSPRHRSSSLVKRLAEISHINGDTAVARKYLRMLDATLFHRRWAKRFEQMPPEPTSPVADDILRSSSDYATSLEWLVENNPDDRYALDYLLCYHLLNKDIAAFVTVYDRYRKGKAGHLPRIYGEALLIMLAAGKAPAAELQSYGIRDELVSAFIEYTGIYERSNGVPDMLSERFGKSYWFYYHFARAGEEGEV